MVNRIIQKKIEKYLSIFPAVAILGPRQCGKSTLAHLIASDYPNSIYLDLEKDSDLLTIENPSLLFEPNRDKLICLDEIQNAPELFRFLRSEIDEDRRPGRMLLLGSASVELIRQSSESLAGRIGYIDLTPFFLSEIHKIPDYTLSSFWNKGGYPDSFLASSDELSFIWRENFVRTYIERDIPKLGFRIDSMRLNKMVKLIASQQGQLINFSKMGELLQLSSQSARNHIELLESTFLIRVLRPYFSNIKKRLVKSPKIYIRDSGLLHTLLGIENYNELLCNYIVGQSWEGFAIEQITSTHPDWEASFYRTSHGAEIDLILEKKDRTIAVEFKLSDAPKLQKGFYIASNDHNIKERWVIIPKATCFKLDKITTVSNIEHLIATM